MSTDEPTADGLYAAALAAHPDAVILFSGLEPLACSIAARDLFACSSDGEVFDSLHDSCVPIDGSGAPKPLARYLEEAAPAGFRQLDCYCARPDGTRIKAKLTLRRFEWDGVPLSLAILRDRARLVASEALPSGLREGHFRALFAHAPEGIVMLDSQDRVLDVNERFLNLFDLVREDTLGRPLTGLIVPPEEEESARELTQQALAGQPISIDAVRMSRTGEKLRVSIIGVPIEIDAQVVGAYGIYRDITEQHKAVEALAESEARLRTVIRNSPLVLFALDSEGKFTFSDGMALRGLGLHPGEVVGRSALDLYGHLPDVASDIRRALDGDTVTSTAEVQGRVFETQYTPASDDNGVQQGIIGVARDITDHRAAEERLEYLSHHDPLTGLANRSLFYRQAQQAIREAQIGARKVAVLVAGLDQFRGLNDSLGSTVGDRLLREVARRFRNVLRDTDVVARIGGDEFALVMRNAEGDGPQTVADKLVQACRQPFTDAGVKLPVTVSVGVALYPSDGTAAEALLKNADGAMTYAKREGGDGMSFYAPGMDSSLETLELTAQLREAVEREAFELHYQPIVDLDSGRVVAVEALIRWPRPTGLVSPDEFIPLAERIGLIQRLGRWVIRTACAQVAAWRTSGNGPGQVGVNLSARQFQDEGLTDFVAAQLAEHDLPPDALLIEITESTMFLDRQRTRMIMQTFREMGITIAIDDFGTGYSSLGYLKELPVDILKVDRTFINGIPHDEDSCTLTHAIIAMARSLKLRVVAEGIETPEQLDFVRNAGCGKAQGYLFSRPLPVVALESYLDAVAWEP